MQNLTNENLDVILETEEIDYYSINQENQTNSPTLNFYGSVWESYTSHEEQTYRCAVNFLGDYHRIQRTTD